MGGNEGLSRLPNRGAYPRSPIDQSDLNRYPELESKMYEGEIYQQDLTDSGSCARRKKEFPIPYNRKPSHQPQRFFETLNQLPSLQVQVRSVKWLIQSHRPTCRACAHRLGEQ